MAGIDFSEDALIVLDESHQSVPQIRAMYNGDRSRKVNLTDFGFRLPSALGSRHPAADPGPAHGPPVKFKKKVKSLGGGKRKAGGCD